MATRKLGGLDRIAESLPGQAQLPCLESVLAASDDVETHCSTELRGDAGQVPAFGALAVLVDEGGRGGQYADPSRRLIARYACSTSAAVTRYERQNTGRKKGANARLECCPARVSGPPARD